MSESSDRESCMLTRQDVLDAMERWRNSTPEEKVAAVRRENEINAAANKARDEAVRATACLVQAACMASDCLFESSCTGKAELTFSYEGYGYKVSIDIESH